MKSFLEAKSWDVVLSDYSMPGFDAPAALQLLQETGQDLPFIVISGTIGEEAAVAAMKNGAHDYLMKGNLARLGAAIEREIKDAGVRREHRLAIDKIQTPEPRAARDPQRQPAHRSEKDPVRLIDECCECLVATGVYDAAWIALLDDQHKATDVAGRGYARAWEDVAERLEHGKLPFCATEALSSSKVVFIDEQVGACQDCVIHHSMGSHKTLTVRIEHQERVYGVMAVTLLGGVSIDESESSLFEEVAGDIGFALWSIETERARRAEEERFRVTFDHANIGKVLTAPDGRLVRVNQAFCDLLGYSRAEMEGKDFASVTHPDDLANSREAVRCLLAGEQASCRIEKRYLHKDGRPIWTDLSIILLHKQDGSPDKFITHVLDISERKQLEEELIIERTLLREIADNFPNSYVSVISKDLTVAFSAGQEFQRQGLNPRDFAGKTLEQVYGDHAEVVKAHYLETFQGKEKVFELTFNEQYQLYRTVPLRNSRGEVDRILAVVENITERKKMQAQIAQSDRLASMGMLAAGVAHEINNPLAYVLYNLESLTDDLPRLSAAMRKCLDVVVSDLATRSGPRRWGRIRSCSTRRCSTTSALGSRTRCRALTASRRSPAASGPSRGWSRTDWSRSS